MTGRCSICKRRMVNAWACPALLWNMLLWRWLGGRMDCGGDCFECMAEVEGL